MKKRMIKLMTIFCMTGILTVNSVITGQAEELEDVGTAPVAEEEAPGEEPEEEIMEELPQEETVEEVTPESEPQEETVEETTLESEPQEEIVEEAVPAVEEVSAQAAGMPVVMAAETETKLEVKFCYHNKQTDSTDQNSDYSISYTKTLGESITLASLDSNVVRRGYEFLGWCKGNDSNTLYQPGATYTVTEEDCDNGLTFNGVWRQVITTKTDGDDELFEITTDMPTEITYKLPENATKPNENYQFSGQWMLNGKGPLKEFTLKFNDTTEEYIFTVSADSSYGIEAGTSSLSFISCWNPAEGYSDFLIKNETGYTDNLTIKAGDGSPNSVTKDEAYHASAVNDKDELTFETKGWSFSKKANELKTSGTSYVEKDGHYYLCKNLDITSKDFEKTVTITYEDTYSDTTFSQLSSTGTIHPGVTGQTWKKLLPEVTAERGKYQFAGWNYFLNGKDITNQIETQEIEFKEGQTLVVRPVWKGTYLYNENVPDDADAEVHVPGGGAAVVETSVKLPTLDQITGKYTFEGWKDSEDTSYAGESSYTVTKAEETFTAQWKKVSHQIRFVDTDGKVLSEGTAEYHTPVTWPAKPEKEGYTFDHWEVTIQNENQRVSHGEAFNMGAQDLTFTAQWKINSYKISYDGNGASIGVPTETIEQDYQTDYQVAEVAPARTGYSFQGWSDGTNVYQPGDTFKVPAKDVVLKAQWKVKSHQVSYDGNGGKTKAPDSRMADYNSTVSVANGLDKDGYVFEGWEQISTGKVLTPGASFVMPDMDETLKAKWKIAYTGIYKKGTYYLIKDQPYILGGGLKAQGDSSTYTANITIYVPKSGYYIFE